MSGLLVGTASLGIGLAGNAAALDGHDPSRQAAVAPAGSAETVPAADGAAADGSAGATTPFTSEEAETGTLGGGATAVSLTSAPTTRYSSPALEASGHAYVHLADTGQSVQWTNTTGKAITAVNVRESIPDSESGGGSTATLDLYVDGVFRQALALNSRQSWLYEGGTTDGADNYNGNDQNPSDGDPRVFFDESRAFVSGAPIAPGSTLTLRKDAANTADYYDIDVVDVEDPPDPRPQPAGSISIESCGAVADNTPTNGSADSRAVDSTAAIQNCINQAQSQQKTLWIPRGIFYLKGTAGLQAKGITIAGAGTWYSTLYRDVPLPNDTPLGALLQLTSTTVENLHLDSDATSRATADGGGGAMDTTGTNWTADTIWSQHTESGFWASGTGGTVKNCRLTSIWADGINLNNVSLNSTEGKDITATNNFVRGTGDDAIAINSVDYNQIGDQTVPYTPMSHVTITHNTSIAPWGGKGVAIYGGGGHVVEDNYISDTARYIGLGVGKFGVNGSNLTSATVSGNVIVRSGGNAYDQGQPALHIGNGGDGHSTGTVDSVDVTGNTVTDALYDGVGLSTSTNTRFTDNTVASPGRDGIVVSPPFYPAPTGSATISRNTVTGLQSGNAPYLNNSPGFVATITGNNFTVPVSAPFHGTEAAVPGTVQAEDYDTGGPGVGYHVNSVNGSAPDYRQDMVDLEATSDTGGGLDLGWTSAQQWFRYSVDASTAGSYTVGFRVASPTGVTGAFHLADAQGTDLTDSVDLPATGGNQAWATVTADVTLPAGPQVLTLVEDTGGWNLNSLSFTGKSPTGLPAPIDQATWYELVNRNSGACVDDTDSSMANGNPVQQWSCTGGTNQQWRFRAADDGYYEVQNRHAASVNQAFDVKGGATATQPGAPLQTWQYGAAANQQFMPVAQADGGYRLVARHSGLCLEVPRTSPADGTRLAQNTCDGTTAQSFRLVPQR